MYITLCIYGRYFYCNIYYQYMQTQIVQLVYFRVYPEYTDSIILSCYTLCCYTSGIRIFPQSLLHGVANQPKILYNKDDILNRKENPYDRKYF